MFYCLCLHYSSLKGIHYHHHCIFTIFPFHVLAEVKFPVENWPYKWGVDILVRACQSRYILAPLIYSSSSRWQFCLYGQYYLTSYSVPVCEIFCKFSYALLPIQIVSHNGFFKK